MGERIVETPIKREKGYLYYIDKEGYVARAKMKHGANKITPEQAREKLSKLEKERTRIKKEKAEYREKINKLKDKQRSAIRRKNWEECKQISVEIANIETEYKQYCSKKANRLRPISKTLKERANQ